MAALSGKTDNLAIAWLEVVVSFAFRKFRFAPHTVIDNSTPTALELHT